MQAIIEFFGRLRSERQERKLLDASLKATKQRVRFEVHDGCMDTIVLLDAVNLPESIREEFIWEAGWIVHDETMRRLKRSFRKRGQKALETTKCLV